MASVHTGKKIPQYQIPDKAYERPKWFKENFWVITQQYISYLMRVCGHLPKWQVVTFSDIVDDTVHIHYGKFSIYFPIWESPENIGDWLNNYELEIDHKVIPMSTGLELVESSTTREVERITEGNKLVDTFLPPKIAELQPPLIATQNKVIKNTIRIRKK